MDGEQVERIDAELRLLATRRRVAIRHGNAGQAAILADRITDLLDRRLEESTGTGGQTVRLTG